MRLLASSLALLAACLSTPSEGIRGRDAGGGVGDGGGNDGAGDLDAVPGACPQAVSIAFTELSDLDDWVTDSGVDCNHAITGEGLTFTNDGNPSACRAYRDRLVDLTGKQLRVRLIDHDPDLAMSISLIIGSPEVPFDSRRWLYFERDQGELRFGECSPEVGGCSDYEWGSTAYDPELHVWLGFSYAPGDEFLTLETSNGDISEVQAAPSGVSAADFLCVAVDLGSYEVDTGPAGTSSFVDLTTD